MIYTINYVIKHIKPSHKIIHLFYLIYCLLRHRLDVYFGQLFTTSLYHLTFYVVTYPLLSQPFYSPVLLYLSYLGLLLSLFVTLFNRMVQFL